MAILTLCFGAANPGWCGSSDTVDTLFPAESSFEAYARGTADHSGLPAWRLGDTLFVHQSRAPVDVSEEVAPKKVPRKYDPRQMAADMVRGLRHAMLPARGPEDTPASELLQVAKPGGVLGVARRPKNPVDVLRGVSPLALLWMLGPAALLLAISGVCGRLARNVTPYSRPGMAAPPAPPLLSFDRKW